MIEGIEKLAIGCLDSAAVGLKDSVLKGVLEVMTGDINAIITGWMDGMAEGESVAIMGVADCAMVGLRDALVEGVREGMAESNLVLVVIFIDGDDDDIWFGQVDGIIVCDKEVQIVSDVGAGVGGDIELEIVGTFDVVGAVGIVIEVKNIGARLGYTDGIVEWSDDGVLEGKVDGVMKMGGEVELLGFCALELKRRIHKVTRTGINNIGNYLFASIISVNCHNMTRQRT